MHISEFDYELPEELIAQQPVSPRDHSRLMVVKRSSGEISTTYFYNIVDYLQDGDVMVFNWSRVIPARLEGRRQTGGRVEILLLREIEDGVWEVLVKRARRVRVGERIYFSGGEVFAEVLKELGEGRKILHFYPEGVFDNFLEREGRVPLPPYIHQDVDDPEKYQTVYARISGSVAAPTAGFHFTENLLNSIKNKGVRVVFVTLHIGLGTFRPVMVDRVEEHRMHEEWFEIDKDAADVINGAKSSGRRIFAVGTTSVRVLETVSDEIGRVHPQDGWTDIFIYPGFRFRVVDALVTNFHLPRSTLLMLVYAFGGRLVKDAYHRAIKERFRFYSFGDAMLIL